MREWGIIEIDERGINMDEREFTRQTLLYELRLIFSNGKKKQYTVDEICKILDKVAQGKYKKPLDKNGFDAATVVELKRRMEDIKAGRNIVEHDLIDL